MAETLRDSKQYGYATPDNIPFDFASFKKKRDENILGLNRAYESNWSREGITLVHGTAKFVGPKELEVAGWKWKGEVYGQAYLHCNWGPSSCSEGDSGE